MKQKKNESCYNEVDTLLIELGFDLIPMVDKEKGAELLERINGLRHRIANELGLVIPFVRIVDNSELKSSEYCIKLKGVDSGRGIIRIGHYLCINPGTVTKKIKGIKTNDPAFGLPSLWISHKKIDEARSAGYTVADPPSIITTHLDEIIKRNASDILGLQDVQNILDKLRKKYPIVVKEAMKEDSGLGVVQIWKILQGLLMEKVSIRNMLSILEAIAENAPVSKDIRFLSEKSRQALARQICSQYTDNDKLLHVLTIDPVFEQKIIDSKVQTSTGDMFSALEPSLYTAWINSLKKAVQASHDQGFPPVILCSYLSRFLVKTTLDRIYPEVAVLSVTEIANDIIVIAIGVIEPDMPIKIVSKEEDKLNVHKHIKDPDMEVYLWTLAAEEGDTDAMLQLGLHFFKKIENRFKVTENRKTKLIKADIVGDQYMGEYWLTKAASKGVVKAQYVLGAYYHSAEHGPKDYGKAVYWYTKAANQGYSKAQLLLGNCYYEGEGVQKDPGKAAYWWSLAAAQGNEEAKTKCENFSNYYEGII